VTANGFAARDHGVFALSGRVTFQTVPQFMAHTDDWLQTGAKTVMIDMQGVTLADSAGVALMLEWLQRARAAGRELVFTNLPDQVQQLIHVSGLQQVFPLR